MKKVYCDRCGREIDPHNDLPIHIQIKSKVFEAGTGVLIEKEYPNKTSNFDVCIVCIIETLLSLYGHLGRSHE